MAEKIVGKVTHFFPKISVAVVHLEADLKNGDKIKFVKGEESFEQVVESMQVEHEKLEKAKKGQDIGMKTDQPVKAGTKVLKA